MYAEAVESTEAEGGMALREDARSQIDSHRSALTLSPAMGIGNLH